MLGFGLPEMLVLAIIACIPAAIAYHKGRSFIGWWVFGVLLWIVAIIASCVISKDEDAIAMREGKNRRCPYCSEWIRKEAIICKYCNKKLSDDIEGNGDTHG